MAFSHEVHTTYRYLQASAVKSSTPQSRSQSFVPLDKRSENASSGSNHYERTKEIHVTEFWLSGSLRICIYGACLKWLLPELSFSDRWSRGTKLWERDWPHHPSTRHFVRSHQETKMATPSNCTIDMYESIPRKNWKLWTVESVVY